MNNSTIVALSTPSGEGAIGVIRLSGEKAVAIVDAHTKGKTQSQKPNTVEFARFYHGENVLDEVVVSMFKAPNSYTGEDVCEISFHGSQYVINKALESLIESGAELAQPGEFTQRAFLNGKMDLSQAEAVADLIASESEAEHNLAMQQMRGGFSKEINKLKEELINFASLMELELDFSEEDVEFANREQLVALINKIQGFVKNLIASFRYGNAIKQGVPVAIIGKPNAGKSTLLNALLNDDRAIVSEIAGTTRDAIEDVCVIDGIRFRFIDTAGIRDTEDVIEKIGVNKSLEKMKSAALVIYLFDHSEDGSELMNSSSKLKEDLGEHVVWLNVANKCDLGKSSTAADASISAKTGIGMDELRALLSQSIKQSRIKESPVVVTNARHLQALKATEASLQQSLEGINSGFSGDLVSTDIRQALHHLGSITGEITTDDLLGNIFGKFCIGK